MLELIEFQTYLKIIGGVGFVGLATQFVGILRINKDIRDVLAEIEKKRTSKKDLNLVFNLPFEIEKTINSYYSINENLKKTIFYIKASAATIGIYLVLKNWDFPFENRWVWNAFVIGQYGITIFLLIRPIWLIGDIFKKYIDILTVNFKTIQKER